MKKITFCILSAFVLLTFIPTPLKAENDKNTASSVSSKSGDATEAVTGNNTASDVNTAEILANSEYAKYDSEISRLEEIKAMDRSELTAAEKKELRDEVHSIQRDMDRHDRDRDRNDHDNGRHHHDGGVYFTVGGGLLVILLLILLL